MAENKNSFEDSLTNLALIVDGVQKLFPRSKSVLIYELNQDDFNYVKSNFRNLKIDDTQIKIDISGTEIVFILENSYKEEPIVVEEEEKEEEKEEEIKETFFSKLKNLLTSKKSS
jgi:hypothetical protein